MMKEGRKRGGGGCSRNDEGGLCRRLDHVRDESHSLLSASTTFVPDTASGIIPHFFLHTQNSMNNYEFYSGKNRGEKTTTRNENETKTKRI